MGPNTFTLCFPWVLPLTDASTKLHTLLPDLRSVWHAGLGAVAGRSLQLHFDAAIACMRLLHTHTASAAAALDSISHICLDPSLRANPGGQINQVCCQRPQPSAWPVLP